MPTCCMIYVQKTEWLDLVLGHGNALSNLSSLKGKMKDVNNLLQVSMSEPSVKWKALDTLRPNPEPPDFLCIGRCGIHSVLGAYKTRQSVINWGLEKLLKYCCYVFKRSLARCSYYLETTNFNDTHFW